MRPPYYTVGIRYYTGYMYAAGYSCTVEGLKEGAALVTCLRAAVLGVFPLFRVCKIHIDSDSTTIVLLYGRDLEFETLDPAHLFFGLD